MSKNIVLYSLLERTFALLLGNEDVGENCEFLLHNLDVRIQKLRRYGITNELLTSLSNLKSAVVSLRSCFKSLTDDFKEASKQANTTDEVSKPSYQNTVREKTKQTNNPEDNDRLLSCPKDAELQNELQEIKETDKFKQAMEYFRQSNTFAGKVYEKENRGEIKITATKVRVISEILGNLTNLSAAAENCKGYLSQLNHTETLNLHKFSFSNLKNALQVHLFDFPAKEGMDSVMHINVVLFRFMKEFTRKPVAMLNWPMIDGQGPEKFHPILGELPIEIVPPDPFTHITDISKGKVHIDSCIAAIINCVGDIFAKEAESTDIVRITPNCNKWYSFNDDRERKVISITIDCADCKTSTESRSSETSTQSCAASPSLPGLVCCGKMYILVRSKFEGNFRYFIYVIDMKGKKNHEEELVFLKKSATEESKVEIFCTTGRKLVILEFTRRATYARICNDKGELQEKIDMTTQLGNRYVSNVSSISYNGEIVCSNDESKLSVYNLLNKKRSFEQPPSKAYEIDIQNTVKAVAYNHELAEFIILCYDTWSSQYHLVTYTKAGQLIQDIRLNNANDKYREAKLICHPNGPVVLVDNHKLLYLKR